MRGIRVFSSSAVFSRSLFFGFSFFSTDRFYSRCCHFFSDLILATYTHTHTRTTKMPSDEQQLAEPLLDDGGNDRFVLFPLKYDAVGKWYVYHTISFFYFQNLSVFEAFESVRVLTFSSLSLSLSLPIINYSTKAQASFWTAGTFYFFFSFVLISILLDFFFFALALVISINLLLLSLKLFLFRFHRGSGFTRRHEALGKAHRGREALHLACWRSCTSDGIVLKTWAFVS